MEVRHRRQPIGWKTRTDKDPAAGRESLFVSFLEKAAMKGRARDEERIRVGGKPSAVPTTPLGDTTRVWRSPEIDPSSCILELDEQARLELAGICDEIRNSPVLRK